MTAERTDLAALLVSLRQSRQLSQGQLARLARCTRPYIGQLERGKRQHLSERLARQLADALHLQGPERQHFLSVAGWPNLAAEGTLNVAPPLLNQYAQALVDGSRYPGVLHDSQWTVLHANTLAYALFQQLGEPLQPGESLVAQVFSPLNRRHIPDWEGWARSMLAQFKRDSAHLSGAAERQELLARLRGLPDFARLWQHVEAASDTTPTMPVEFLLPAYGPFRLEVIRLQFVGLPELWHVSFLPADAGARQLLQSIAVPPE
ncbi:helix-turn-helix transcriptional regulator [Deinococcus sp.]|uniref:helix-turn-helix transcriptional regulator n=1 Tax=Deinococcus sp. TaxID=47478 RepID=UPI0025BE4487|nr:helix-turn-helix transcriptional regulator [Deinococcus sp.]